MKSTVRNKVLEYPQPQDRLVPIEDVLDDLMAFWDSLSHQCRGRRLVFLTDSSHSDQGFQLSMSVAKRCGLLLHLVQITPEGDVTPNLVPEIVTLDAAGIPFTITYRKGELQKEISRYVWQRTDAVGYIIDVSDGYWGSEVLQAAGFRPAAHRLPFVLLVENGCLVCSANPCG